MLLKPIYIVYTLVIGLLIYTFYLYTRPVETFEFRDELALKYYLKKEELKRDWKKKFSDELDDADTKVTGQVVKTLYPERK